MREDPSPLHVLNLHKQMKCEFIHQIHYIRFRNHPCPFFVQCIKHWSFCGEVQLHQQLQKLNPCIPYDIDTIDFVWKSSLTQRFKKNGSKFQVTFYTATQQSCSKLNILVQNYGVRIKMNKLSKQEM